MLSESILNSIVSMAVMTGKTIFSNQVSGTRKLTLMTSNPAFYGMKCSNGSTPRPNDSQRSLERQ